MSDADRSVDDTLAAPLLGASPDADDHHFDTDGGESLTWTPAGSPRSQRYGSGQAMHSPFAGYRDGSQLSHLKGNSHSHSHTQRESRARRTSWISIDTLGRSTIFQADKRALLQRFKMRLPVRDMRLVDPNLLTSETGRILVRDNGIVVSIEHVRLIIMAEQVVVTKDGQEERPLAASFADALQSAVGTAARDAQRRAQAESALAEDPEDEAAAAKARQGVAPLPFELVVLEVALGDVCNVLQRLTKELELLAHPALEALTRDVSTANLERVRKVKTRHQRLMARVTTVREELERFLEDDDDMMKMCLSRRKEVEAAQLAQQDSVAPGERMTPEPSGGLSRSVQRQTSVSLRRTSMSSRPHAPSSPRGRPADADDSGDGERDEAEADAEALEAVENLLESYFVQIDGTFDKLEALGEYVEDTEEYINIELDSSRNRLIKLEVVLTAGTFALAIFTLVGGILGENVRIPPGITKSVRGFWAVNGITAVVCIVAFYAILTYIRLKRLL